MPSTLLFLTFATILITATSLTFTLFIVVALFINHSAPAGLAVTAAFFDILDIAWVAYPLVGNPRGFRDTDSLRRRPRFWTVTGLALAAHVLTAALLACTQTLDRLADNIFDSSWEDILHASWGLMAASIICHIVYLHGIRPKRSIELKNDPTYGSVPYAPSSYGEPRAMVLQHMSPSESASHQSSSPSSSKTGKDPAKASAQEVHPQHYASSQTHLIRPLSYDNSFRSSYRPSWNSADLESGMTTPQRSPSMHSETFPARPSTPVKQRLEPIPGSAANSPGRALDIANDQPTSASRRHQRSTSQQSVVDSIDESRVPPRFRKNSTPQRPQSPVVNESHIHPLFRSDSPLPPPAPTFNTTVVASAFGGRTMSKEDLHSAYSRSRPSSPVTRPSMTRSRNGSFTNRPRTPNRTASGQNSPSGARSKSLEERRHGGSGRVSTSEDVPPVPSLLASPKLDGDMHDDHR